MEDADAATRHRDLIARVVDGDEQAARAFYDEHFDYVWSIISRFSERQDDAKDLAQEAFIRIFDALPDFRGDSAVRTWIFRVCYRCALDEIRRLRADNARPVAWLSADDTTASTNLDPYLRARIAAALDALTDELREVFLLYEVYDMTHEEIGGMLDIPTGTSKSRLSIARQRLRDALASVWKERTT